MPVTVLWSSFEGVVKSPVGWGVTPVITASAWKYALEFATQIARKWDTVISCGKWHEQVQLTNFWKRKWNDKKLLTEILTSQNKVILNSKEIKKAYLQNLKYEKGQSFLTTDQYYSNIWNNISIDNKPSWMFKSTN